MYASVAQRRRLFAFDVLLLDGTYSISVTAGGFEKSEYSGVVVDAGRITDVPLTLKLGAVSETVHVAADATPLETTSNQVATTVRNDAIIDYSLVPLRLDAIDEVSISTSGLSADAGAGGAMTIQFTTKRGANKFHGSLFEQFQNTGLNANNRFDVVWTDELHSRGAAGDSASRLFAVVRGAGFESPLGAC